MSNWLNDCFITSPAQKLQDTQGQARADFKTQRSESVRAIKVTTAARNCFDGDEESQTRMARAIIGLDDGELLGWVLADNTQIEVDSVELKEALKLAGAAQSALWVQSE